MSHKRGWLRAQVAAERHSEELRGVCIDVALQCLPDVLVRPLMGAPNQNPVTPG
jgi:hypothetical protein